MNQIKTQLKLSAGLFCALVALSCEDADAKKTTENPIVYPTSEAISSIPLPPDGKRWVIDEQFSDEFNGTSLDESKWLYYHPSWKGREPGLFESKNVAVSNGMLRLWGQKMDKDTIVNNQVFNISCAAVVSKTQEAHYGYYEARFKANRTGLSTTFWLSSRGSEGQFPIEGNQPGSMTGKFSQELDIFECIGYDGGTTGSNGTPGDVKMAGGMNANVHYWYTPTGDIKYDGRIEETVLKLPNGAKPTDDFNVYGCWWKDQNNVSFYLNNDFEGAQHRKTLARNHPVTNNNWNYDIEFNMSKPMGLNMVVETYPYPWVTLPLDEHLADRERSTTLYDWVRVYDLIDANAANPNPSAGEMTMFESKINLTQKLATHAKEPLTIPLHYTAASNKKILIAIYDDKGEMVYDKESTVLAGYANSSLTVDKANWAKSGESFTLVVYLGNSGSELDKEYEAGDSYKFSVN